MIRKGFSVRARRGEVLSFTGISHPWVRCRSRRKLSLQTTGSPEQAAIEVFALMQAARLVS